MLNRYLRRKICEFEREWEYDAAHLLALLDASPRAFAKYALMRPALTHREAVPAAGHWGAALTATQAADCGPCLDLAIKMARRDGMALAAIDRILAADPAVTGDAALGSAFARAVLFGDAAETASLRSRIVDQWGQPALGSLSLQIAVSSFYPNLRRALVASGDSGGSCAITGIA